MIGIDREIREAEIREAEMRLTAIRTATEMFIRAIAENCPDCGDRTAAIRKAREAMMTANASIVLNGRMKATAEEQLQYLSRDVLPLLQSVSSGFEYDPGHSDLDDEQPIHVKMTLGDYRRAKRLRYELERHGY